MATERLREETPDRFTPTELLTFIERMAEQMPRYDKAHVSDQDLADIYAYVAAQKRGPKAADIPLLRD